MKTQSPVISKSSRQMQVLDLAQVNSAFPNNIIALIPSSYINKLKKPILTNAFVQTEALVVNNIINHQNLLKL